MESWKAGMIEEEEQQPLNDAVDLSLPPEVEVLPPPTKKLKFATGSRSSTEEHDQGDPSYTVWFVQPQAPQGFGQSHFQLDSRKNVAESIAMLKCTANMACRLAGGHDCIASLGYSLPVELIKQHGQQFEGQIQRDPQFLSKFLHKLDCEKPIGFSNYFFSIQETKDRPFQIQEEWLHECNNQFYRLFAGLQRNECHS